MPEKFPLFSVVIATFNSAKLLPITVGALKRQSYPKECLEILAVDGGSSDDTREVARSMGCRVIDNPRTEPVHAKYLGFQAARGKYLMCLDHDEEMINPDAILQIVRTFENFSNVRTVDSSGYVNPPGYSLVNEYINEFGEPFSFFVYRQSRGFGFHLRTIRKRARMIAENSDACVFAADASNRSVFLENLAAGIVTDIEFVKALGLVEQPRDLGHIFFIMNEKGADFAVAKNNPLCHYSGDTWAKFFPKIRWRVKNNVYHLDGVGAAGFSGRQGFQSRRLTLRKYLFLPYAFSVFFPLIDGILLSISRRRLLYLTHPIFTLYTALKICQHMALRSIGHKPEMRSYDEKSIAGK